MSLKESKIIIGSNGVEKFNLIFKKYLKGKNKMKCHNLKVWPEYFQAVMDNKKTFEIRENDRDFIVGDILLLQEWCPKEKEYTGKSCNRLITYMTDFGQPENQVVMSIREVK